MNTINITRPTNQLEYNQSTKNAGKFKGFVTGLGLASGLGYLQNKIIGKAFTGTSKNLTQPEIDNILLTAENYLNQSKLASKGTKILNVVVTEHAEETVKDFSDNVRKVFKWYPEKIRNILSIKGGIEALRLIEDGKNSFYDFEKNKIYTSPKSSLAIFHETGHALNQQTTKIGKLINLKQLRKLNLFLPVMIFSLFTKNKKEDENNKLTGWGKFTNFVRNNAGKITFISALPLFSEEVIASIKGNKIAKAALSPESYKKVFKSNAIGAISYFAAAVISGLSAMMAVKVKDKVQAKFDAKQA